MYGALPGIAFLPEKDKKDFLESYARIYLEEEIRAEALSRKIGAFSRFLELSPQLGLSIVPKTLKKLEKLALASFLNDFW